MCASPPFHFRVCAKRVYFTGGQVQAKYSKPVMTEIKPAMVFYPAEVRGCFLSFSSLLLM